MKPDRHWLPRRPAVQIFMAGHSSGAGVATLLAYAAQSYLDEQLGPDAPIINTVLFAQPNVGPPAFVSQFDSLVNARRITYQDDIVTQASLAWASAQLLASARAHAGPLLRQLAVFLSFFLSLARLLLQRWILAGCFRPLEII